MEGVVWGVPEKVSVKNRDFRILSPTVQDVDGFTSKMDRAGELWTALKQARASFAEGRAWYENAAENFGHLLDASNEAAEKLIASARDVSSFFDPPNISNEFLDPRELVMFAREAIANLAKASIQRAAKVEFEKKKE